MALLLYNAIQYLFIDVDEEEELKIMALQRRRNQLAGYCKLIIFGVLELRAAADVFKYYSKVCVCMSV